MTHSETMFKNISELYENNHLLPTNIASISEAAQMPRETVRRSGMKLIKLKHLEKKGRDIYRYNYPKKGGEIDNFLKVVYKINEISMKK